MKQVFVSDCNNYKLVDGPEPTIESSGDIVVKVRTTTVCGSDVHILAGHMHTPWGFPLGHEFVGVVHQLGSEVRNFKVGDRVVAPAAPWCGQCGNCRRGQTQVCERGGIFGSGARFGNLGGAQAEYVRVPFADTCVSHIPDGVTDAQALTVGDVLSTGWTAVRNAVSAPGQMLLVFGAGPVGLSAIHTARLHGVAGVIAVDTVADRLALAKELGATHVIDPSQEDTPSVVATLTGGRGAEAIVDAAGVNGTINAWSGVAALGARIAMVGIPAVPVEINLTALLEKNVSMWMGLGDLRHMDMLLSLIAGGTLDPSPIFTETIPFRDIERAIAEFIDRKPGLVKPLIPVD
ncbi:alcohol dehydrogenase catalytic domain-containing protein [Paraburkholderia sp. Ac-20347]|uniref:zinc-dependent alcohol dehydrogenase n=1 Tax=Paraburkholderia sp. Ac-20347 TaxID=2703892 RepID=UPI00198008C4|nr:alcohol dehydrogenase catalytic domain-containing protein [Paraburkholderia sp. Ac-20347]MBN3813888.1 alcohol dehydrogenase catalytic domain-containing protein [Paraburkholderia sp. Ac-20347]